VRSMYSLPSSPITCSTGRAPHVPNQDRCRCPRTTRTRLPRRDRGLTSASGRAHARRSRSERD
jgi:hypothetical protein